MEILVSKNQLERVLDTGEIELQVFGYQDGQPVYAYALVGEPFATLQLLTTVSHIALQPYADIGHQIQSISALEPVNYFPSYVHDNLLTLATLPMIQVMKLVAGAVQRPVYKDGSQRTQFMQGGSDVAALVYDSIVGDGALVLRACNQPNSCLGVLDVILKGRNITPQQLAAELKEKWQ